MTHGNYFIRTPLSGTAAPGVEEFGTVGLHRFTNGVCHLVFVMLFESGPTICEIVVYNSAMEAVIGNTPKLYIYIKCCRI